jgi:hypothetical protein
MSIIIGAVVMVSGVIMTLKSEWIYQNFGSISFMDKYFGTEGGGRLGYKLLGILVAFIGMLMFTGMIGGFLNWLFYPVLKFMTPASRNMPLD